MTEFVDSLKQTLLQPFFLAIPIAKQDLRRQALSVAGLLLLTLSPAPHAGERNGTKLASEHQLSEPSVSPATAPYQFDPRYRMTTAATGLADKPFARQIDAAAREAQLDPALVHALISVESAYQSSAVSPKGALGLMQVLPDTALSYGITNAINVNNNLRAGTRHLQRLMDIYDNRVDLALAAYNAGEGAVTRYNNTIPPYAETRNYVPAVISKYQATTQHPSLKHAAKLPPREYMAGTRLNAAALAKLD